MTAAALPSRARAAAAVQARVLNVEQAAAYLGTNRNEIYRLTRLGELQNFYLFDGGPQRWLRDDLDAYVDAMRTNRTINLTLTSLNGSGQRKTR